VRAVSFWEKKGSNKRSSYTAQAWEKQYTDTHQVLVHKYKYNDDYKANVSSSESPAMEGTVSGVPVAEIPL
jgi:hypothetical protein